MNYHPKNRSRNVRRRAILFFLAVFIVGGTFFYFFGGLIATAVSPIWKTENAFTTRISLAREFFRSRQSLIEENESLKDRINSLEVALSNLSALSAEESAVLSTFGRGALPQGIAASVLARPPRTPYDFIVVDAGGDDGVTVGMEVALTEGPLLGEVVEVFSSSAKVKLFSSSGVVTPVVLERAGITVELEGSGGGNFRAEVPRETPIEVGDRILSADVLGRMVAVVEEIKLEQTDSFKEVLARSPESLFNVRFVILRP